jgi:outer membrane autotransporter protein
VTLLDNNATLDATDLAAFAVTDTALVDYTNALGQTDASSDSLIISASKRTTAGIASYLGMSSSQTAALGQVTAALASGDATASTAIDTVLVSGGATAVNAVEQLNPDAGAATGSALAAVSGVNNVIASRQTNTRVAFNARGNQSGISTGDDANDAVVWAQIFGSSATQDKVGTIDGYDADSSGLALGWETEKSGDLMGLSVSYSDSDVDGKSASASHTDTTAVQVSAYGTYGKATDWMVGYASGDNDTKRTVNFGGLSLVASGKYDSNIFTAKVGHAFASSNSGDWTMTPKVDASYTNIDNDGYTETGANNLNLKVASSSNDILTARVGAEFTQRIVDGDAVTIPHFNIMAGYDLTNDGGETSSTFTGGGSAFTTKGADPEKASIQLGFGVDHVSDDSTVSLDLNADLRSDYDSMSGSLTFKSKF